MTPFIVADQLLTRPQVPKKLDADGMQQDD